MYIYVYSICRIENTYPTQHTHTHIYIYIIYIYIHMYTYIYIYIYTIYMYTNEMKWNELCIQIYQ